MEQAAALAPIEWQAKHDVDGMPALGPVDHQMSDVKGGVGAPIARRRTPLDAMLARKTISAAQYDAGVQFARLFAIARFDPLRAADLLRPPGGAWVDPTDAMIEARDQVWAVLDRMGGIGSPSVEAAWIVVGQERSIKEFCQIMRFAKDRPLNQMVACGLVNGALSVMVGCFGVRRGQQSAVGSTTFR